MVQSDLDSERVENIVISNSDSGGLGSREPSFSRWCDEDGVDHFDQQLSNTDASVGDDSDFELPFLQNNELESRTLGRERLLHTKIQQRSMHVNGANMDDDSIHLRHNGSEKYVSFDIEDGSERRPVGARSSPTVGSHGSLGKSSSNPVSVADVLKTLFFILVWYIFSLFLTLYNKSLLGDDLGKFPAPLLMNTVHFAIQAVLSKSIIWFWPDRFETNVAMSWSDYFLRVIPTALGTAMDVNLSNASLVSISVTFATMCKSAAPIFLLLFAFALRLEKLSLKLTGIIMVISFGILLSVAKETEFELRGFILVMLAAVMSGFRWCMTQVLLQKEAYGLKNPLTLMSYVTPIMTVATAILSLASDPWDEFRENNYFNSKWHITRSALLMLFGGILAFFMVLTEFILVSVTSAVTVTIAGVVKEAVTILVAVFYFHDEFTWLKGLGLFTIMVGVGLFNWYKYLKLQKGHTGADEAAGSKNTAARYVILEEMDEQEDST
ncbi:hypothetical protein L6164_029371 [Bauhinia variegata]|uniref:Uncharacterized protein n=1 Tax=Bauhinia variegata TaxID=167791 RepID=A0ACB9L962_BAUVA|nr:hypothetical protein L6164_029371 [Bauhinia variegata]